MAKIATLHINNFKFFGQSKPIEVDGKHLLIYGENGSGKSSIYWALYTLLECTRKEGAEIQKYFNKEDSSSLINLYAEPAEATNPDKWNSYVSLKLDNEETYRISSDDIVSIKRPTAKESSSASDFVNYRFASKIHDFRHGTVADLLLLFTREVFPYIETTDSYEVAGVVTRSLNILWDDVSKGAPRDINGKKYGAKSDNYKNYLKRLDGFNEELERLLANITSFGNTILHDSLGYPSITFSLKLIKATIYRKGHIQMPLILFDIPLYEGLQNAIKYPQSFLNEAKLTAIGLSIRLGILNSRLSTAELKILVLDDLLISLDMANRQTILDLILDEYTYRSKDKNSADPTTVEKNEKKFQVIILTHDAQFNHFVKSQIKIRSEGFIADWQYIDMYEHIDNGVKSAMIINNDSHLDKARKYFYAKRPDFEAAGNYLRKEAEGFTKSFLPKRQQVGYDYTPLPLSGLIQKCNDYAQINGLDTTPFKALNQHREFIFNALSHDDYDVPRFRSEIGKCFKTFDDHLNKIEYCQVLNEEEQLVIELQDEANLYKAVITIYEPLVLIKESGKDSILAKVFANYQMYKDGNKNGKTCTESLSIEKLYNKWYATSNKVKSSSFWDEVIISKTGAKLSTLRKF